MRPTPPCRTRVARCLGLVGLLALPLLAQLAVAAVPSMVTYQGFLVDETSLPRTGSFTMAFALFSDSTGGTTLWSESYASVPVNAGVFTVLLGAVSPLTASVFSGSSSWLETSVDGVTLSPRRPLSTVGYAFRAAVAESALVAQAGAERPPVGAVIAWLKTFTNTPALPTGWVECNGQTLDDGESPYNGLVVPDLNGAAGTGRFLRGGTESGSVGGSEGHSHNVTVPNGTKGNTGYAIYAGAPGTYNTTTASTLPSYFEVVWIMRVR